MKMGYSHSAGDYADLLNSCVDAGELSETLHSTRFLRVQLLPRNAAPVTHRSCTVAASAAPTAAAACCCAAVHGTVAVCHPIVPPCSPQQLCNCMLL